MFKFVVFAAVLAVAAARPGVLAPAVYSTAVVGSVPTSVSSSSSSIVHNHALVAPVVRTAPVVTAPLVAHTPLVHSAVVSHTAPVVAAHAPVISTYAAAPALAVHGSHLIHAL